MFDAHDDGNIFSPPCADIQISDSSSDNLNVLKISICLEENEESSSFRKKYIINRIFIQNSSGLFLNISMKINQFFISLIHIHKDKINLLELEYSLFLKQINDILTFPFF